MDTQLNYTFEPLAYYSEQDAQWYPSVKTLLNGQFHDWQVFEMGFDDPKYAMPYAREFAREIADMTRRSLEAWLARNAAAPTAGKSDGG